VVVVTDIGLIKPNPFGTDANKPIKPIKAQICGNHTLQSTRRISTRIDVTMGISTGMMCSTRIWN
jgi:hypothetical protein